MELPFFSYFLICFPSFLMNSPRTNQYFPMPFNIIDPQFHSILFLGFCVFVLFVFAGRFEGGVCRIDVVER
jgi:hypothetical protein